MVHFISLQNNNIVLYKKRFQICIFCFTDCGGVVPYTFYYNKFGATVSIS